MPLGTPRAPLDAQEPPRPSWHRSSLRRPAFPGTPVRSGRAHCTLATQASPTQLPLPPATGRSSSPATFPPLSSAFCASARGCPSTMRWERATTLPPPHSSCGQTLLPPSVQQPRSSRNDTGLGQRENRPGRSHWVGGHALRFPSPPRQPQQLLDSRNKTTTAPKQNKGGGCHRLRRCERRPGRVLRSGSWKAQAGAVLGSAVGQDLHFAQKKAGQRGQATRS